MHQSLHLPGINASVNAYNYDGNASMSFYGDIQNSNLKLKSADMNFWYYEDDQENFQGFSFGATWQFEIGIPEKGILDLSQHSNFNFFGLYQYSNMNTTNLEYIFPEDGPAIPVVSDHTRMNYGFDIQMNGFDGHQGVVITDLDLGVSTGYSDWDGKDYLSIYTYGNGHFLPESGTLMILGMGSCLLRLRRKH
ncbi:MAG: hypothetical protein WC438_02840 [Candidatus Pacearchaeota archaeon]